MKRVLVVDDDPDILDCLKDLLEARYTVVLAANGQEALDAVQSAPFDLVVLDLMMPVVDGEEFARQMHASGITIPVLVASAGQDVARRAKRLGAADYVAKPFDIDVIEAKIASIIAPDSGGGGPGPPPSSSPRPPHTSGGGAGTTARSVRGGVRPRERLLAFGKRPTPRLQAPGSRLQGRRRRNVPDPT